MSLYEPQYHSTHYLGPDWDVYCLICGGPSLNPAKITKQAPYDEATQSFSFVPLVSGLTNLPQQASAFDWLDQCVGISEDNVPVELGLYDHQGDFNLPGNRLFGPYPSYAQAERTANKVYGLNCHAKCYQLLHARLKYKLRYQDIWPKLAAANDDSECLDSTYGGITEYHEHLFEYNYMNEDKAGWMLLDPTENEQNAERILKVWEEVPEVRRPLLMLAVLCSFKRAAKLAEAKSAAGNNDVLWTSMAKVPSTVLRTILERAYFHPDFVGSPAVANGS